MSKLNLDLSITQKEEENTFNVHIDTNMPIPVLVYYLEKIKHDLISGALKLNPVVPVVPIIKDENKNVN